MEIKSNKADIKCTEIQNSNYKRWHITLYTIATNTFPRGENIAYYKMPVIVKYFVNKQQTTTCTIQVKMWLQNLGFVQIFKNPYVYTYSEFLSFDIFLKYY